MFDKIEITKTDGGFPALWEESQNNLNHGSSTVIAGLTGNRKTPIYIGKRGRLIPLGTGDYILKLSWSKTNRLYENLTVLRFDTDYMVDDYDEKGNEVYSILLNDHTVVHTDMKAVRQVELPEEYSFLREALVLARLKSLTQDTTEITYSVGLKVCNVGQ